MNRAVPEADGRIPIHVLTGFLGSGKTTLLRHLLADADLADTAVVINEFEVVPETPKKENRQETKKNEKGGKNEPPTDYEMNKMLQKRFERLERISTY